MLLLRPTRTTTAVIVVSIVAALAASLGVATASPASALQRIIAGYRYGDFEATSAQALGWSVSAPSPNKIYTSTSAAISGSRSLKLEDTSASLGTTAMRTVSSAQGGKQYELQAYAHVWKGRQLLGLRFYDSANKLLARKTTWTTNAVSAWSRLTIRATAPRGAARAVAELASGASTTSQVWWDAVEIARLGVANSGFELRSSSRPAPYWSVSSPSGTRVARSTSTARVGGASLYTSDGSRSYGYRVTSSRVKAYPGVEHTVRGWIRRVSGSPVLTVRFLDASGRTVRSTRLSTSKPTGRWSLVSARIVAPTRTRWATIQMSSTGSSTSSAYWDAFDLRPSSGGTVKTHALGRAVQPVDAIANTNLTRVVVEAGRPKLVGIVSGQPAELQVVDIQTNTVEHRFPLGNAAIGWALTQGPDGAVYAGSNDGHVRRWALGSAAITDLGAPTTRATSVWDLESGPDGRLWGVSYPGAELWSWSPTSKSFSSVGSLDGSHQYARSLAVDSRYLWVGLGSEDPVVMRVSLSNTSSRTIVRLPTSIVSGNISQIDTRGRYLAVHTTAGTTSTGTNVAAQRRLYDTSTGKWTAASDYPQQHPSPTDSAGRFHYLSAGQLLSVDGSTGASTYRGYIAATAGRDRDVVKSSFGGVSAEWLTIYDPAGTVSVVDVDSLREKSYRVRFAPTKMRIKSVAPGPNGTTFVGGYGGSSLAVLDSALATTHQYPDVPSSTGIIGEIEGSITNDRFQYLGSYTGGGIFRYDTARTWVDGSNPRQIANLGPSYQQDRPLAWATYGSRTFFGTIPRYGVLGGALGIIDTNTSTPRVVREPVTDQSVVSLAARGNVVYGGTSRWGGLGATPTQATAKVFAYDASTNRKLWEVAPANGVEAYGAMAIGPGGTLWAAHGTTLVQLDPRTGRTIRTVVLQAQGAQATPVLRNAAMVARGNVIYLVAAGRLYSFDPATLRVDVLVTSGIEAPQLVVRSGQALVPRGSVLQEVTLR